MNDINWITKVDFGWYASDGSNNLAIIFSELETTPNNVLKVYSNIEDYSWITSYVIDKLKGDHGMGKLQDVSKGFYVYEYNEKSKCYECLAIPKAPLKLHKMKKYEKMIIKIKDIKFGSSINWESGNI